MLEPVVATPMPSLKAFGDFVACSDTAEGFCAAIAAALVTVDDPTAARTRELRAKMFDWECVAHERLKVLGQRLAMSAPGAANTHA